LKVIEPDICPLTTDILCDLPDPVIVKLESAGTFGSGIETVSPLTCTCSIACSFLPITVRSSEAAIERLAA